jgi:tight adherence protein C
VSELDPVLIVAGTLVFGALAALAWSLRAAFSSEDVVLGRLRRLGLGGQSPAATIVELGLGKNLPRGLRSIAKIADPGRGGEGLALRRQLTQGGYRGEHAVQIFLAAKVILALVLPVVFLLIDAQLAHPLDLAVPIAIMLCIVGFYAPSLWLATQVKVRQGTLERSLPETVDLLVTCVEAGLALDAALSRVSAETALSAPLLAEELNLTFLEIQAGMPRVEAFRRLSDRTGVEDLRSMAATLAQTELFGTSIATALRTRAEWIRTRRMQRAEENAAIVAVKMTIPLVFCILPSLIAIVMGPAVVNISKAFLPHVK